MLSFDFDFLTDANEIDAEARDRRATVSATVRNLQGLGAEVDGITADRWFHHPHEPRASRDVTVWFIDAAGAEGSVLIRQTLRWKTRVCGPNHFSRTRLPGYARLVS